MPAHIASMFRLDRADEAKLLAEAARQIERVGLGEQIDQLAGSLSLGQQRIVEIARALCVDPMLLLLDEPAAGLRHMEKQRLAALLRQLRDGGMSVLLVEHDMGFVMDLADRIVVLDFGTKIAEGTPAAIKTNPDVIKAYLGARRHERAVDGSATCMSPMARSKPCARCRSMSPTTRSSPSSAPTAPARPRC